MSRDPLKKFIYLRWHADMPLFRFVSDKLTYNRFKKFMLLCTYFSILYGRWKNLIAHQKP